MRPQLRTGELIEEVQNDLATVETLALRDGLTAGQLAALDAKVDEAVGRVLGREAWGRVLLLLTPHDTLTRAAAARDALEAAGITASPEVPHHPDSEDPW